MLGALLGGQFTHHLRVVDPGTVAALRLAPVERSVGKAEELLGACRVGQIADAGRQGDAVALELSGRDRGAQALDECQRVDAARLRQEQRELVSTNTREYVLGARAFLQLR